MRTVVQFIRNHRTKGKPDEHGRNRMYSRSLRKIAFIDNRHPASQGMPAHNEHWLVDIVRENQNDKGGCFILKPLMKVPEDELMPLVHGMYEMENDDDAILLTPTDTEKFWVLSPLAKKSILEETPNARALVIVHGSDKDQRKMWTRRRPPESLMEQEARALLSEALEDDDVAP